MAMLTFRYRIKDATSGTHLLRMAWACHTVWNFCNEVSRLAWRRDKHFLSAFDLINLCAGAGHDLGLHTDTLSAICQEYARKRKQFHKITLRWRSRKRSLGWIPFKGRCVRLREGEITYKGRRLRFWHSRPVGGTVKTGNFSQDACGHWYVNLQCEVDAPGVPLGEAEIGIDLGLKNQLACSDMPTPYCRANLTRQYATALARAQPYP